MGPVRNGRIHAYVSRQYSMWFCGGDVGSSDRIQSADRCARSCFSPLYGAGDTRHGDIERISASKNSISCIFRQVRHSYSA